MKSKLIPVILTAAVTSVMTIFAVSHFQHNAPYFTAVNESPVTQVKYAGFDNTPTINSGPANFEAAAASSVKAVVHVKTMINAHIVQSNDFFSQFYGPRQTPAQEGSGSGVVISPDGYIVTNNHVVAGANEVTVTFNEGRTMQAKVVGTDASTDIAVLKVDQTNFGNSDDVKLGQWVLAVGYPLTLDATVTAGIISAKSRSLGINQQNSATAIESFLQTDAAVNPGNSGGALVNTSGLLIGINSAIASPTGSYAGYSYAIPSNIVRKAVNDLIKYGALQRGYLGIRYFDSKTATPEQLAADGITDTKSPGMYVADVAPNSGAAKAGLRKGDFITAVNGTTINTQPELQEQIARFKPGDNVSINFLRNGKPGSTNVQLSDLSATSDIVKEGNSSVILGTTFRPMTPKEQDTYGPGVVIADPGKGIFERQTNIGKGFIIKGINDQTVSSVDEVQSALTAGKHLEIAGFYPGRQSMYYYGFNGQDAYRGNQ